MDHKNRSPRSKEKAKRYKKREGPSAPVVRSNLKPSKMCRKIVSFIIVLFAVSLSATAQANDVSLNTYNQPAEARKPEVMVNHHVVIEVTSPDSLVWKGVMNNVKHLKDRWGDSIQIEVVAHGPGINMLVIARATEEKKMTALKKTGLVFLACENTMRTKNISKQLIVPEAGFVPSGVVEIVSKQEEGWSYLKGGF